MGNLESNAHRGREIYGNALNLKSNVCALDTHLGSLAQRK